MSIKKKHGFYVGQRVRYIGDFGRPRLGAYVGTIIGFLSSDGSLFGREDCDVLVQFDRNMGGHNGYGEGGLWGKDGHCWFTFPSRLTPIQQNLRILE